MYAGFNARDKSLFDIFGRILWHQPVKMSNGSHYGHRTCQVTNYPMFSVDKLCHAVFLTIIILFLYSRVEDMYCISFYSTTGILIHTLKAKVASGSRKNYSGSIYELVLWPKWVPKDTFGTKFGSVALNLITAANIMIS